MSFDITSQKASRFVVSRKLHASSVGVDRNACRRKNVEQENVDLEFKQIFIYKETFQSQNTSTWTGYSDL
jgi:hypothetical protein